MDMNFSSRLDNEFNIDLDNLESLCNSIDTEELVEFGKEIDSNLLEVNLLHVDLSVPGQVLFKDFKDILPETFEALRDPENENHQFGLEKVFADGKRKIFGHEKAKEAILEREKIRVFSDGTQKVLKEGDVTFGWLNDNDYARMQGIFINAIRDYQNAMAKQNAKLEKEVKEGNEFGESTTSNKSMTHEEHHENLKAVEEQNKTIRRLVLGTTSTRTKDIQAEERSQEEMDIRNDYAKDKTEHKEVIKKMKDQIASEKEQVKEDLLHEEIKSEQQTD